MANHLLMLAQWDTMAKFILLCEGSQLATTATLHKVNLKVMLFVQFETVLKRLSIVQPMLVIFTILFLAYKVRKIQINI